MKTDVDINLFDPLWSEKLELVIECVASQLILLEAVSELLAKGSDKSSAEIHAQLIDEKRKRRTALKDDLIRRHSEVFSSDQKPGMSA